MKTTLGIADAFCGRAKVDEALCGIMLKALRVDSLTKEIHGIVSREAERPDLVVNESGFPSSLLGPASLSRA